MKRVRPSQVPYRHSLSFWRTPQLAKLDAMSSRAAPLLLPLHYGYNFSWSKLSRNIAFPLSSLFPKGTLSRRRVGGSVHYLPRILGGGLVGMVGGRGLEASMGTPWGDPGPVFSAGGHQLPPAQGGSRFWVGAESNRFRYYGRAINAPLGLELCQKSKLIVYNVCAKFGCAWR